MMKLQPPLEESHPLKTWANCVAGFYGGKVYLVGSQITAKENPRDVDVVCIISDKSFEIRFGNVDDWMQQGGTGLWTEVRWKWADASVRTTEEGMSLTKLPIDFKVYPETLHKGFQNIHDDFPPYRLDNRK